MDAVEHRQADAVDDSILENGNRSRKKCLGERETVASSVALPRGSSNESGDNRHLH